MLPELRAASSAPMLLVMARSNCQDCGGTGWRLEERPNAAGRLLRVAVRCACDRPDAAAQAMERACIPARYSKCTFESFDTNPVSTDSLAETWARSLREAKLVVQGFVSNLSPDEDQGLLLMGPSGVGKTHLAVSALKELALRGHDALFCDYADLLKKIQASYNPESQTSEMDILEPILSAEILLLDDLGSSKPSAWALETVGHILNTRYNAKRITLVTTNFLDAENAQQAKATLPSGERVRADESLGDRVGHRIRSRLFEMCRTIQILARDYRTEFQHAVHPPASAGQG